MTWPNVEHLPFHQVERWALRQEAEGFVFFVLMRELSHDRWQVLPAEHAAREYHYACRTGGKGGWAFLIVDGRQVRWNAAVDASVANNVGGRDA